MYNGIKTSTVSSMGKAPVEKLKINFITQSNEDIGSTRSRVYKIAQCLKKRDIDVTINGNSDKADILVYQKSNFSFLQKSFLKYSKTDKFICFDIDDYDPKYNYFVRFSDLVIVSTEYLKNKYAPLNDNIIVIANIVDVYKTDIPLAKYNLLNSKLVWFGNICNKQYLTDINVKNVTTITNGGDMEWTLETIDENLQKFDLVLIPQKKDEIGLAKCNCRMLKALYLGMPVLVSEMPVYLELSRLVNYPEEFIVKDGQDWNEKINAIKEGKIKFEFDFNRCRKIILDNYGEKMVSEGWLKQVYDKYKKYEYKPKDITKMEFCIFLAKFVSTLCLLIPIKASRKLLRKKIYKAVVDCI